jgi:hypothetical protein
LVGWGRSNPAACLDFTTLLHDFRRQGLQDWVRVIANILGDTAPACIRACGQRDLFKTWPGPDAGGLKPMGPYLGKNPGDGLSALAWLCERRLENRAAIPMAPMMIDRIMVVPPLTRGSIRNNVLMKCLMIASRGRLAGFHLSGPDRHSLRSEQLPTGAINPHHLHLFVRPVLVRPSVYTDVLQQHADFKIFEARSLSHDILAS